MAHREKDVSLAQQERNGDWAEDERDLEQGEGASAGIQVQRMQDQRSEVERTYYPGSVVSTEGNKDDLRVKMDEMGAMVSTAQATYWTSESGSSHESCQDEDEALKLVRTDRQEHRPQHESVQFPCLLGQSKHVLAAERIRWWPLDGQKNLLVQLVGT